MIVLYILSLLSFLSIQMCRAVNTNVRNAFQWKFANNVVSSSLPQCSNVSLMVDSDTNNSSALGTAPYYLIAYELGGVATTTPIGSNPSALVWPVNHAAGTTLMLTMADADGNSGGIPNQLFTVTQGKSSSCLPLAPTTTVKVQANVTTTLNTCQQWGLTVTGGVQPYTISLAQTNSPLVTNVTLGTEDDVLTFINRADPNQMLLAAVSDATGQFGVGTFAVQTAGAAVNNQSCGALVTRSGNSTLIQQQEAKAQAAATAKRIHQRTTTIIAACVSVGVFIIIVCIALFLLYSRRRRRMAILGNDKDDIMPQAFEPLRSTGSVYPFSQLDAPHTKTPLSHPIPLPAETTVTSDIPRSPPIRVSPLTIPSPPRRPLPLPDSPYMLSGDNTAGSSSDRPNSTDPRLASENSLRLSRKATEMRQSRAQGSTPRRAATALQSSPSSSTRPAPPVRSASATARSTSSEYEERPPSSSLRYLEGEGDVRLFQHRDGGTVSVREVPPPYADYTRGTSTPTSNISPSTYYESPV